MLRYIKGQSENQTAAVLFLLTNLHEIVNR